MPTDSRAVNPRPKTPEDLVVDAQWWIDELGDALPEASACFKALVDVLKELHRRTAERDRLRAENEALKSGRARVEMDAAIRQLEGENEALKAILDGTDVGALDRALRASYERGYPPEEREGWESYAERCPSVVAHMRESVRAMFAAALASGAPDDLDATK